ncbi:transposase [Streptomyces camelliae]|uniref:Transposase n=1 Tax=Streptomyces camelliae TaxID=3004093 RepID=A0ABY7NZR8_9ACTN|nr:transposase [Streptomyces sp. HUAS 2-6]WBO63736.1 transposase [Streptomyces sp. HUAS 2-6]
MNVPLKSLGKESPRPNDKSLVKRAAQGVGDSETGLFWSTFLRSLPERGLGGVRLVIANRHSGRVKVVRKVMLGAAALTCRFH